MRRTSSLECYLHFAFGALWKLSFTSQRNRNKRYQLWKTEELLICGFKHVNSYLWKASWKKCGSVLYHSLFWFSGYRVYLCTLTQKWRNTRQFRLSIFQLSKTSVNCNYFLNCKWEYLKISVLLTEWDSWKIQDYKGKHWEVYLAVRTYEELGRKKNTVKKSVVTELFGFVINFKISSNSGIEY